MKKLLSIGGGILVVLAIVLGAAYYVLFGVTKTQDIRTGVFQVYNENMLGRIGATMTVFETGQGLVSVDTHLAPLAGAARKKIAQRSGKQILAVFNTHWHPDHTGGNASLTGEADIIAHENVAEILARPHKGFGLTKPGSTHDFKAISAEFLPEILVNDEARFTQYGAEFYAAHYPHAHTDSDLVIFAPQHRVVVLGDLVWPQSFPFVDVHNGGTAQGIHDALVSIIEATNSNDLFAIGHGAPVSQDDLREYVVMLAATIDYVRTEKAEGKTLASIQDAGFPGGWNQWESKLVPVREWIKMIYETI